MIPALPAAITVQLVQTRALLDAHDDVRHMRGQAEALLAGPPDSARVPGAV